MPRPLLCTALILTATCQSSAPGDQDPAPVERAFVHLEPATSLTVAEGGRLELALLVRSKDGRDGDLGEPLGLAEDLFVAIALGASQGADVRLVDARGRALDGGVRVKAGRARMRFALEALTDSDEVELEEVELRIDGLEPVDGSGPRSPVPAAIGAFDRARVFVRGPSGPVVQFSHTTPETYPYPSAKTVARGARDYWGMRLTDSGARSADGTIAGKAAPVAEPLLLTYLLSGDARLGDDFVLFDHSTPEGGKSGPAEEPLAFERGLATVLVPPRSDGWVLWGRFEEGAHEAVRRVELRLVSAVGAESGTPYTVGWNDRVEWFVLPGQ